MKKEKTKEHKTSFLNSKFIKEKSGGYGPGKKINSSMIEKDRETRLKELKSRGVPIGKTQLEAKNIFFKKVK